MPPRPTTLATDEQLALKRLGNPFWLDEIPLLDWSQATDLMVVLHARYKAAKAMERRQRLDALRQRRTLRRAA